MPGCVGEGRCDNYGKQESLSPLLFRLSHGGEETHLLSPKPNFSVARGEAGKGREIDSRRSGEGKLSPRIVASDM